MKIKAGYINNMRSYLLSVLIFIGIFAAFAAIIPIVISKFVAGEEVGTTDILFATICYVSFAYGISNLLSFNSYISFGMSRRNFSITSILTNLSFCAIVSVATVLTQKFLAWFISLFGLGTSVRMYLVDELGHGNILLSIVAAFFLTVLISNIIYVIMSILNNTSSRRKLLQIGATMLIGLILVYLLMSLGEQTRIDILTSVGNFFGISLTKFSLGQFIISSSFITFICMAFTTYKDQRREIKTKIA